MYHRPNSEKKAKTWGRDRLFLSSYCWYTYLIPKRVYQRRNKSTRADLLLVVGGITLLVRLFTREISGLLTR